MSFVAAVFLIFLVLGGVLGAVAYFIYRQKLRKAKAIERGLKMVPILIHLPSRSDDTAGGSRDIKEVMREKTAQAEVLYNLLAGTAMDGFRSQFYGQRHIALELIAAEGLVHFYAAVPVALVSTVEKAIQTAYPGARMEMVEDHNIFNQEGRLAATLGGEMILRAESAYPIATYAKLDRDPMEALLTSISALEKNDGVAFQLMIRPATPNWISRSLKLVDMKRRGRHGTGFSPQDVLKAAVKAPDQRREEDRARLGGQSELTNLQQAEIESIEEKTKHPGFEVLIRLIVSTSSVARSQQLVRDIATTFALYDAPGLNGFSFLPAVDVQGLVTAFIFRFFPPELKGNVLNSMELATLFHLPDAQFTLSASVERQKSKQIDGPTHLSSVGLLFGFNEFRGVKKEIRLSVEDRRRHTYILGQTGTGKSTMLENLAVQDMLAGNGFAFIDPHGDSAEKLLALVPKNRAEDVIYFNPADTEYPLGLNLFEFTDPAQKDFLVQETINMLYKLYDPGKTGIIGPRYEHWYRNAALTLMSDPNGSTFIEIPKVFTDTEYLKKKFKYLKDPTVIDFWTKEMGQTSDYHKSEMLGWFVSKFGAFQNNEMMRNIIGQTKSSFNLRDIMDQKKILIVNLSKGKVGELNSQLLGMIFVIKFQAAAMSRANVTEDQRPDFSLYVDEFQNFSTDSFASILSEARKYRLNLIVANQFIGQLSNEIRDAVFGNIGSIIAHRMGPEDADFMVKQFAPVFDASDLMNLPNYNAAMRLMIGGLPSQPFTIVDSPPLGSPNLELGMAVKQLSAAKYGHEKRLVEADIFSRLTGGAAPAAAPEALGMATPAPAVPQTATPPLPEAPAPVAAVPTPIAAPAPAPVPAPMPAPVPDPVVDTIAQPQIGQRSLTALEQAQARVQASGVGQMTGPMPSTPGTVVVPAPGFAPGVNVPPIGAAPIQLDAAMTTAMATPLTAPTPAPVAAVPTEPMPELPPILIPNTPAAASMPVPEPLPPAAPMPIAAPDPMPMSEVPLPELAVSPEPMPMPEEAMPQGPMPQASPAALPPAAPGLLPGEIKAPPPIGAPPVALLATGEMVDEGPAILGEPAPVMAPAMAPEMAAAVPISEPPLSPDVDILGEPPPMPVSVPRPAAAGTLSVMDITGGKPSDRAAQYSVDDVPLFENDSAAGPLAGAETRGVPARRGAPIVPLGTGAPLAGDPYANIDILGDYTQPIPLDAELEPASFAPAPQLNDDTARPQPALAQMDTPLPDDPYGSIDILADPPVAASASNLPPASAEPMQMAAPDPAAFAPQPQPMPASVSQPVFRAAVAPAPAPASARVPVPAPAAAPMVAPTMDQMMPPMPAAVEPTPMLAQSVGQAPEPMLEPEPRVVEQAEPEPRVVEPAEPEVDPSSFIHFVDPAAEKVLARDDIPDTLQADSEASINEPPTLVTPVLAPATIPAPATSAPAPIGAPPVPMPASASMPMAGLPEVSVPAPVPAAPATPVAPVMAAMPTPAPLPMPIVPEPAPVVAAAPAPVLVPVETSAPAVVAPSMPAIVAPAPAPTPVPAPISALPTAPMPPAAPVPAPAAEVAPTPVVAAPPPAAPAPVTVQAPARALEPAPQPIQDEQAKPQTQPEPKLQIQSAAEPPQLPAVPPVTSPEKPAEEPQDKPQAKPAEDLTPLPEAPKAQAAPAEMPVLHRPEAVMPTGLESVAQMLSEAQVPVPLTQADIKRGAVNVVVAKQAAAEAAGATPSVAESTEGKTPAQARPSAAAPSGEALDESTAEAQVKQAQHEIDDLLSDSLIKLDSRKRLAEPVGPVDPESEQELTASAAPAPRQKVELQPLSKQNTGAEPPAAELKHDQAREAAQPSPRVIQPLRPIASRFETASIVKHGGGLLPEVPVPATAVNAEEDYGIPQAESLAADDVARARAEREAERKLHIAPEPVAAPVAPSAPKSAASQMPVRPVAQPAQAAAAQPAQAAAQTSSGSRISKHRQRRRDRRPAEQVASVAEAAHNRPSEAQVQAAPLTGKLIMPTAQKPHLTLQPLQPIKPKTLAPGEVFVDEKGNVLIGE